MQPSGNLDLQPGDNVKNMTEEEGRKVDQLGFGALLNLDGVGVVLGVVVGGKYFLLF